MLTGRRRKSPKDDDSLDDLAELKKRIASCARCRNHNITVPLKGHKRYCKYKNCVCSRCMLTFEKQKIMAQAIALRRQQKLDEEMSPSPNTSAPVPPKLLRIHAPNTSVTETPDVVNKTPVTQDFHDLGISTSSGIYVQHVQIQPVYVHSTETSTVSSSTIQPPSAPTPALDLSVSKDYRHERDLVLYFKEFLNITDAALPLLVLVGKNCDWNRDRILRALGYAEKMIEDLAL
ncbi:doublesex- and mab-3-related transcription factor 1-like isoform X1 [Artemia franciscana]|uniref:Doublesex-5 n=1 Tax=Artemia franciscana TaxID=6661 RepID=A0A2S0XSR5_ARTSF|nr:doublesex-5 [Artemia franciscana]KAK2713617.1 hypothetical protein QYM36_009478 [Artemia franciscana]